MTSIKLFCNSEVKGVDFLDEDHWNTGKLPNYRWTLAYDYPGHWLVRVSPGFPQYSWYSIIDFYATSA